MIILCSAPGTTQQHRSEDGGQVKKGQKGSDIHSSSRVILPTPTVQALGKDNVPSLLPKALEAGPDVVPLEGFFS